MPRLRSRLKRPWLGAIVLILLVGVIGFAVLQAVLINQGEGWISLGGEEKPIVFEGSYRVIGAGHAAELVITKAGDGYNLRWKFDDGRVCYGSGIRIGDILGVAFKQETGKNRFVAVYAKQGNELTGLWTFLDYDKLNWEKTEDAEKLERSKHDITGVYTLEGTHPNGSQYQGKVTFVPTRKTYEVVWELDKERSIYGTGITFDDLVVVGYSNQMGLGVVVYEITGNVLNGKWVYTDNTRLANPADIRLGTEKAENPNKKTPQDTIEQQIPELYEP